MKNKIKVVLFALLPSIFAHAENYEIQVCKIELNRVLPVELPAFLNLFHVFVRGRANNNVISLNFEPINKNNGIAIVTGQPLSAQVSYENFEQATCETVFATDDAHAFNQKWEIINDIFSQMAENYNYQVYNVNGKNCGKVAEEAIVRADLKFPFPGINAQQDTDKFLYGLGSLGNVRTAEDAARSAVEIAESGSNILNNIVKKDECCIQ